jgi:hypothetical protein
VRLFDAVVRHLAGLAEEGLVAVLLDDLQWFDEASAALLHFVVRALDRRRVRLIAAARPVELEDNRVALRVVRDLRRDERLHEHSLGPLDGREIAALVQAEDGDATCAECEGTPLFALELARARRSGQHLGAVLSLASLLDDRLGRLDDTTRDLLPWAAARGRTFELETLARVTGQALGALVTLAAALERRGVVRATATGYDFTHDLLRQAAYRQLSEPRRRLVHLQIARALATPQLAESVAGDVVFTRRRAATPSSAPARRSSPVSAACASSPTARPPSSRRGAWPSSPRCFQMPRRCRSASPSTTSSPAPARATIGCSSSRPRSGGPSPWRARPGSPIRSSAG